MAAPTPPAAQMAAPRRCSPAPSPPFAAAAGHRCASAMSAGLRFPQAAMSPAVLLARTVRAAMSGRSDFSPRLSIAGDLAAHGDIWRLAAEAVAAGRALPALEGDVCRWRLAATPGEERRVEAFCRSREPASPGLSGASPLSLFFRDAVDLQMRSAAFQARQMLFDRVSPNNPHSLFLAGLSGPDARMPAGVSACLGSVASLVGFWRARACPDPGDGPGLAFRIADPVDSASPAPLWTLVPVVVSGDDVSPFSSNTLASLGPERSARFLLALGLLRRHVGDLADSDAGVAGMVVSARLDAASLRAFMEGVAPSLSAAGFPVFAPRWWKPAYARRPVVRLSSLEAPGKSSAFSLDSIVSMKWSVALDGTGLTERELRWIVQNNSSVARIGGEWMNFDPALAAKAEARLASLAGRKFTLRELVRLGFSASGEIAVEVPDDALPPEARRLLAPMRHAGKVEPVPVPTSLRGELRPYQKQGLDWLAYLHKVGFGACLADDMGLGKTIETIAAFLHVRECGPRGPVLVVCPMSIMLKWSHELERFAPSLSTWIYHGADRVRGEAFAAKALSRDVCVTSYQMLGAELDSFTLVHWAIVALDEAQNVKNAATVKSRAARALDADWRIAITGTPVENNVGDLWAVMDFINRGLLPERAEFERRFRKAQPGSAEDAALSELRRIVSPFILRRVKTDPEIAAGLPSKVEERVYCHLSREQAVAYAAATAAAEGDIGSREGISRRGAVLALITRLKEICDYPPAGAGVAAPDDGDPLDPELSGKIATLDEMLAGVLAAGEAALVFTQYASFGKLLARHLGARFGFEVPFLHGAVPADERERMVARFQSEDGPPVFLISIRAGGLGFNLTRANHVFHFDRWWNPATENQATDRAHRIGQSRTVFVHTFICDGTLESKIDDLISGKRKLADSIVESGAGWLAGLDDRQLFEIVSLSRNY